MTEIVTVSFNYIAANYRKLHIRQRVRTGAANMIIITVPPNAISH